MIHGVVPSYYLKQMAQAIIQRLDGIQGVRNLVEVRGTEVGRAEHSEEDTFPSHTVEAGATSSDERQLYCPAGDN